MRPLHRNLLIWGFSVTAGIVLFSVFVCAAGVVLAVVYILPDERIPDEHQVVIDGLKKGTYSKIEEISPSPDRVNKDYPPNIFLHYSIGNSRELRIEIDRKLRFVSHYINHD